MALDDGQEPSSASPSEQPVENQEVTSPAQPGDTGGTTAPESQPDPSTPSVENGAESKDPRPRNPLGWFTPKTDGSESNPDPVAEAIAHLARKGQAPATKTAEPPAKAAGPEPVKPTVKPAEQPKPDGALKSSTLDTLNPSDDEKSRWLPKTRERFDKVFTRTRELHDELEKSKPLIEHGKEFNQLLDEFNIREDIKFVPPEHVAGLIATQAGVNRSIIALQQGRQPDPKDLQALKDLDSSISGFKSKLGISSPDPTPPALEPFTGKLPEDLDDLVKVYGIDEKRVRMLAAMEAKAQAPATAAAPQQPQQLATPPQAAPAAPAPQAPTGVDVGQLYSRRFMSELSSQGDQNPAQTMRVLLTHPATQNEIVKRFPGTTPAAAPAVFNALDLRERYEILKAAHQATTKAVPASRPSTQPPPATTQRTHNSGATVRSAAPADSDDPVVAAVARLARPE